MIRGKQWIIGVMGAAFLLMVLSCSIFAEDSVIDSSPYLEMAVGARSVAMGSASTAVVDDATATVWNVAGLSRIESVSVASMYSARDSLLDRNHNFLAIAKTMEKIGTFGFAWISTGVDGLIRTPADINGEDQGTFDSSDNAFLLSYGAIFKPVRLGGGIKILSQKIDPTGDTEMGFGGLDIGVMADPVEAVTVGLTIQSIFGKVAGASVPVNVKLGTALRLLPEDNLLLAVDLNKSFVNLEGETSVLRMGAEYWAADLVGFRLGVTSAKAFSAGLGINISDIELDYAYIINRGNGGETLETDTHYVSICATF
jgi:hypothetical protein